MAKVVLAERFQQFEDTKRIIDDITDIATRADDIRAVEDSLCLVETIFDKVNKGMEEYRDACDLMKQREEQIKEEITRMYQSTSVHETGRQPLFLDDVADMLKNKKKTLKEMNMKVRRLNDAKKKQEYSRKHARMQQMALPVQFDLSSTPEDTKGYFKKKDGTIQAFSYDLTKEQLTSVADYLWNTAS